MEAIQLIQVTPAEFASLVAEAVRAILPEPKPDDAYLTADEVKAYLKISPSTLQRWQKNKKITGYTLEGTVRYKKSEVTELLKPLH